MYPNQWEKFMEGHWLVIGASNVSLIALSHSRSNYQTLSFSVLTEFQDYTGLNNMKVYFPLICIPRYTVQDCWTICWTEHLCFTKSSGIQAPFSFLFYRPYIVTLNYMAQDSCQSILEQHSSHQQDLKKAKGEFQLSFGEGSQKLLWHFHMYFIV